MSKLSTEEKVGIGLAVASTVGGLIAALVSASKSSSPAAPPTFGQFLPRRKRLMVRKGCKSCGD